LLGQNGYGSNGDVLRKHEMAGLENWADLGGPHIYLALKFPDLKFSALKLSALKFPALKFSALKLSALRFRP
jgi:hypothetical protein